MMRLSKIAAIIISAIAFTPTVIFSNEIVPIGVHETTEHVNPLKAARG